MAAELEIHKSTVFRLLVTLERRGMVEQRPVTLKYRLGHRGGATGKRVRGAQPQAGPVIERLSEVTDETVNLAVLEGAEVANIDQVNLSSSVVSVDWLGQRSYPHLTATEKVFLPQAPPRVVEEYLSGELVAVTPNSITSRPALEAQLEQVRRDGYATTRGELEEGLPAVAAGVRGEDGSIVAAIAVSGPSYRVLPERMPGIGRLVVDSAAEVDAPSGLRERTGRARGRQLIDRPSRASVGAAVEDHRP